MHIFELHGDTTRVLPNVVNSLQKKLGKLERVGGSRRVYMLDGGYKGVIYLLAGTTKAVAFVWPASASGLFVSAIFVWNSFDVNLSPDYALDLPQEGSLDGMIDSIAEWVMHPTVGAIGINTSLHEMASRTTAQDFIKMAQMKFGDESAKLTMPQMIALARDNDVQIPGDIRSNSSYKVDAHHWNLLGRDASPATVNKELGTALGGEVEEPEEVDPNYQDALTLAKAKTVANMAASGKVYLMGRKAKGAFFRIPGLEEYSLQLERMLFRQLQDANNGGRDNMEEQYEMLHDKVKLVAGGKSNFIKSMLITGAPSSGKTYCVMKTIRELGLSEGKDYIVKKGRITTPALYRTLIEQIDGMVIFDDCDSVVDDKNAINMLKGALDTDPIREISYDVRGTLNTAVMDPETREEYVEKISRILRGKVQEGDLETFRHLVVKPKKKGQDSDDDFDVEDYPEYEEDDEDFIDGDADEEGVQKYRVNYSLLAQTQQYLSQHMPNKIDFKGRIIFISNMAEDEWDSAIITRAFSINMDFSDVEMLDYIDKIKAHIKTTGLSEEEKQEVMSRSTVLRSTSYR
jgi:hypothetical protein